MKIGFDIDGVLTNIQKFQLEEGKKFFKRDAVNKNAFTIKDMFDCTENQEAKFWKKSFLKYCINTPVRVGARETILKLKQNGDRIFIITKGEFTNKNNKLGKLMRFIVEEYLKHNKIEYDEIIFSKDDKCDDIIKHNIDIMIEDDVEKIKKISKLTNVICMDNYYNRVSFNDNVKRAESFYQIYNIINNIRKDERTKNSTFKLTNTPSVDMPFRKYYTRNQLNIKIPERTIYRNLFENNITNLNNIAINYFDTKITFSQLFHKIDEACKSFINLGVKRGDIVTICMPNTPEAVISVYALNKIGAVSNMIHPLKSENEIMNYINEVDSKVMVLLDTNYLKLKNIINKTNLDKVIIASAKDSMPIITKIAYYNQSLKNEPFYNENSDSKFIRWDEFIKNGQGIKYSEEKYKKDQLAVIIHTGGTTGTPKGVMLSNDNFNSMITQFLATADNFSKGDKLLTIMPIFHGFGLCSSIHLPLSFGVTSVLIPKFDVKNFYKLFKKYKPNHIIGVPTLWKAMINNRKIDKMDLSYIKYVVTGGDSMEENFELGVNEFLKNHGSKSELNKGYGLSEAVAGATFAFKECNKPGSIGIPMVKTNFKVVVPGTEKELGYNQKGEFCISGPTVMLGYYNKKEETETVLRKHSDGKIWLHTGDMGYITEEGILYYSQRLTRMFISSGINIYPDSIEKVICSIEEVDSCAVIGKEQEYKGKVPKAYIVLKENIIFDDNLLNKIKNACKINLDKYHQPFEIEVKDKLPITNIGENIGKVDYKTLELDEENNVIKQKVYKLK